MSERDLGVADLIKAKEVDDILGGMSVGNAFATACGPREGELGPGEQTTEFRFDNPEICDAVDASGAGTDLVSARIAELQNFNTPFPGKLRSSEANRLPGCGGEVVKNVSNQCYGYLSAVGDATGMSNEEVLSRHIAKAQDLGGGVNEAIKIRDVLREFSCPSPEGEVEIDVEQASEACREGSEAVYSRWDAQDDLEVFRRALGDVLSDIDLREVAEGSGVRDPAAAVSNARGRIRREDIALPVMERMSMITGYDEYDDYQAYRRQRAYADGAAKAVRRLAKIPEEERLNFEFQGETGDEAIEAFIVHSAEKEAMGRFDETFEAHTPDRLGEVIARTIRRT